MFKLQGLRAGVTSIFNHTNGILKNSNGVNRITSTRLFRSDSNMNRSRDVGKRYPLNRYRKESDSRGNSGKDSGSSTSDVIFEKMKTASLYLVIATLASNVLQKVVFDNSNDLDEHFGDYRNDTAFPFAPSSKTGLDEMTTKYKLVVKRYVERT